MALDESPPLAHVANAAISYSVYLANTAWPAGLAAFYPHPKADTRTMPMLGALALLATITAAAVVLRRRTLTFSRAGFGTWERSFRSSA